MTKTDKLEAVFQELFIKNMFHKDVKSFKKRYRTLYNKVIIPALIKVSEDEYKNN